VVAEAHLTIRDGGDLASTGGGGLGIGLAGLTCLGLGLILVRRRRLG
jgi:LPXTG-motif cell wall-anchored protein